MIKYVYVHKLHFETPIIQVRTRSRTTFVDFQLPNQPLWAHPSVVWKNPINPEFLGGSGKNQHFSWIKCLEVIWFGNLETSRSSVFFTRETLLVFFSDFLKHTQPVDSLPPRDHDNPPYNENVGNPPQGEDSFQQKVPTS